MYVHLLYQILFNLVRGINGLHYCGVDNRDCLVVLQLEVPLKISTEPLDHKPPSKNDGGKFLVPDIPPYFSVSGCM